MWKDVGKKKKSIFVSLYVTFQHSMLRKCFLRDDARESFFFILFVILVFHMNKRLTLNLNIKSKFNASQMFPKRFT